MTKRRATSICYEERLILFLRLPAKGLVKTRLAETIGDEAALDLYRCLVSDTLAAVRRAGRAPLVFFHPPGLGPAIDWLGGGVTCLPQEGGDLGMRMLAAFRKVFSLPACSRAVLIGSDLPDLPPAFIDEAFERLKSQDAVIGPAHDGGYYLIGFRRGAVLPAAFEGIEWGGRGVFEATMAVFRKEGVSVHVLPHWDDIDVYEDVKALYDRLRDLPPGRLSTIDYIRDRLRT